MAQRIVLVEGPDDQHFLGHLRHAIGLDGRFEPQAHHGVDDLLTSLEARILSAAPGDVLGVILDADTNPEARWAAIRGVLARTGVAAPALIAPDGLVLQHSDAFTVGVWLMPNNTIPGMLEDFVEAMMPAHDVLWPVASATVDALPEQRFRESHRQKAKVHTWLAWQREPGTPLGQAVTKRYLHTTGTLPVVFAAWLHRLFGV